MVFYQSYFSLKYKSNNKAYFLQRNQEQVLTCDNQEHKDELLLIRQPKILFYLS